MRKLTGLLMATLSLALITGCGNDDKDADAAERLPVENIDKETTTQYMVETEGVENAGVEITGDRIYLKATMEDGSNGADAQELGESFMRTLSSETEGSKPTGDSYGELFEGYDAEIEIKNESGTVILEAFKGKESKFVSWQPK